MNGQNISQGGEGRGGHWRDIQDCEKHGLEFAVVHLRWLWSGSRGWCVDGAVMKG